jgi:uncharacterized protein (DUF2062 family)
VAAIYADAMTEPAPSNPFLRLWKYFAGLVGKLLSLKDTPHAIAGGVAIGMFMGFTPLFGLKTLLCLGAAYLLRCNPIAAVVAVCLHDVVTPIWPILLRIEYDIGYFLLSNPHTLPPKLETHHFHLEELMKWSTFLHVGLPMLVGSLFLAAPAAAISYAITLVIAKRRQARSLAKESFREGDDGQPS